MKANLQKTKDCMLIIDDDGINREILKNIFASQFRFREAADGLEGLRLIDGCLDELCAILLDVEMPEMDGMTLLKILHDRDVTSLLPVFLITSNEELELAREAYEMGVMGVIHKPVVPAIVMRRVEHLVELYQARDTLRLQVAQQERKLQENVETIDALHRNTLEAMASAIEFRDVESGEHTNRIYGITKLILQETAMGAAFTPEEIENMAIGSIMHDVGKIAISDVILNKPGRLTKDEFETMKTHTVKGAALMEWLIRLQSHPSYEYAFDIARHHHERWDGGGYPDGLKGDEISVWSQVVSIADVYDALISPRVYKRPFSTESAVQMILNGECGVFNPKLLDCFLEVEPKLRRLYIPGSQEDTMLMVPPVVPEIGTGDSGSSRELIDMLLLTAAVQSAYDLIISVNLTRNTFAMIDYDHFQTHAAPNEGVFDELIAAGAQSIPEPHRQRFIDVFSRESLLEAYAQGKKTVNLDHPQYADDGRLLQVSTSVLFMEDPRNGDIREITLSRYRGGVTTL